MADRGFTLPAEDVEAAIGRGILRKVTAAQPAEPAREADAKLVETSAPAEKLAEDEDG